MAPRTIVTYVAATVAAVLMFAGVMLVWIVLGMVAFGLEPAPSPFVQHWVVGGLGGVLALAAAVYSFRATLKAQKPKEFRQAGAEVVPSDRSGPGGRTRR